ncbi:hypothetical protein [Gordonia sp. ABSL49_1]|uniref:hypothetical protein n=1 Tax=Gordonia sp. ABSL49_1 TaxID=2920941 RepID=UPI001F0EB5E1|nr:hypothetical protein [Gordonia sp. ABSL49_1]MCH5644363.1 hypothetical protein [Gordonia sp. ABSL49_1]
MSDNGDLESAWNQLLAIRSKADLRRLTAHETVCGQCGTQVLAVYNTDPMCFRITQRAGFENYTPEMKPVELPDLCDVIESSGLTEDEFFAASVENYKAIVTDYRKQMSPKWALNRKSKHLDRPRLWAEIAEGVETDVELSLTCKCTASLKVPYLVIVSDVATRRRKRVIK